MFGKLRDRNEVSCLFFAEIHGELSVMYRRSHLADLVRASDTATDAEECGES